MSREGQKHSPEKLSREIEILDQVVTNALVAIVISNVHRRIERINPEFTRMFGYDEEEAIGKYLQDLIVPDTEVLRFESEDISRRLEEKEQIEFETLRAKKDGETIHVHCRVSPIIINGKRIGGFAFYTDITDNRRAQKQLQKAHYELERRVNQRTNELRKANKKLKAEILERKRMEEALRENEEASDQNCF